ncbi:MAG: AsmA family protein [Elusimicrobia bacterium]|nr:AsmA family protein [Elusimicrobiota bacterium]
MKKSLLQTILKIGAALAVLGLIGLGIGTWALQRYLTPQRVRDLIVSQARKSLQREVSLGSISVGLVQGLVVEKLAVSERPDFKAGRFAEADAFSVSLAFFPLLHGQLAVDKVTADGLKVSVVRRSDGVFNFSDIGGSTAPAAGAVPGGMALSLLVKKAVLRNAGISYKDAAAGQDVKLTVASAKVSDFHLDGPFNVDLDLRADGKVAGKPLAASLAFSGKVNLGDGKPERMSAVIKSLRLEDSGRELRLSGKVANLAAPKLDLAAKLSLAGAELASVEAKGVITSTGPKPAGDLTLKVHTPGFDPRAPALQALVSLPLPKGLLVPEADLAGRFKLAGDELAFDGLKVRTKLGTVESTGRLAKVYSAKPEPDLKAQVHLEVPETKAIPGVKLPPGLVIPRATVDASLKLTAWQASFDSLRVKTAGAQVEASGTVADLLASLPRPQGFKVKVSLDIPKTKASTVPYLKMPPELVIPAAKVDAELALQGWDASISSLRVKAEGTTIDASGSVKDLMGKPTPGELKAKAHVELPKTKGSAVPFVKLPADLVIPAATVDADLALRGWDASITSLKVKAAGADLEASGEVSDLMGKPKGRDFKARLRLDFPATKAEDVALVKLPAGLVVPAAKVDAVLRSDGEDVTVDSIKIKTSAGEAEIKGLVRKPFSGSPEPELSVTANLALPAFKSADIPFPQVPPDLQVPASKVELSASGGMDNVEFSRLRLVVGKNDLEVSGKVKSVRSKDPVLDLLLKCRSFVLDELTQVTPETREQKLSGKGFFALSLSGPASKFLVGGKMKFDGIGATVAGLALSEFTGTASFDERRIDIPNLTGKVADGKLAMDLTVKNYRAEPFIDLVADLDRFDLGRYLTAKAALAAQQKEKEAKKEAKTGEKPKPTPPLSMRGRFTVGELRHPNVTAKGVKAFWELSDMTPDMKSLDGTATLQVAGGNFNNIGKLATQSPIVKVLIFPLLIIQKIGGIGGIRIFPDFNNITFTEIAGDYKFDKGVMTVRDTHLYSDAAQVESQGTINLPTEKLDLTVTAQVGRVAPMEIKVTGSFDKPVTKTQVGKFIKQFFQRAPQEEAAPTGGQ